MKEKIAAHSEKEYIFSGEETLSYGLKGKKHKKEKTRSQERSTRKKHRTTYNTKQNLTTKNNTYRLQREKIYPAERKTPTYGLQKYRDRKNIPVCRPERHTEKSHIFKVFILQAQILKFLSRY